MPRLEQAKSQNFCTHGVGYSIVMTLGSVLYKFKKFKQNTEFSKITYFGGLLIVLSLELVVS